jgi:hypothetical protein
MALRKRGTNLPVPTTGATIAHGLKLKSVAVAPDEYGWVFRGDPPAGSPSPYLVSVGTTSMVIAAASGACTVDYFAAYTHSSIE